MKKFFGQVSWYTAVMLLNAGVGLLVVPVTIYVVGPQEWGSIAVGQSVGSIAAIFIALGWGYNGPVLVARATAVGRKVIAINSLIARSLAAPLVLVLAAVVAYHLAPTLPLAALLASLTVTLAGLGMSWYFVGDGNPKSLFFLDGVPRWAGSLVGSVALVISQDLFLFLWIQLAGGVLAVALSITVVIRNGPIVEKGSWGLRSAFIGVRSQLWAGTTVVAATSFAALPTLVLAALAPTSVPIYALGERLVRFAIMSVTPFFQWVQAWVPRASDTRSRASKIRLATNVSYCLALPLGLLVAFVGPFGGHILSVGVIELPLPLTMALGIAVASSVISRVVGMACLLTLGDDRSVALSSILGALVGTPLLFLFVSVMQSTGAAVALALAEIAVVTFQLIALYSAMRRKPAVAN
jgi:O-antigen/teichoic acid export membrane protein